MELKNILIEMFSFFKLNSSENKKEYKKRILTRSQEILDGINCTLEETITLKALWECRAEIITINNKIEFGTLTKEELNLSKGNAKDYEKYIYAVFFNHLDENKFKTTKERLYDETIQEYNKDKINNQIFGSYDYHLYQKLIDEEELEEQYGDETITREKKQKIITKQKRKNR